VGREPGEIGVSRQHEPWLRTPLNAIGGYAELLAIGVRSLSTPKAQDIAHQAGASSISSRDQRCSDSQVCGSDEYRLAAVPSTALRDTESMMLPGFWRGVSLFVQERRQICFCLADPKLQQWCQPVRQRCEVHRAGWQYYARRGRWKLHRD
jgi:hypothetical protein